MHAVDSAVFTLPFNDDLPCIGQMCAAASPTVLDRHLAIELRRHGWVVSFTQGGCVMRKAMPDYPAKRYEIRLRRLRGGMVQGQGELALHGEICASTAVSRWRPGDALSSVRKLVAATESLNVFADSGF